MAQDQLSVTAGTALLKRESAEDLTPVKSVDKNIERNKKGCEGSQKKK